MSFLASDGVQTLNLLHKTVIDYDYFQFMKEDYDYTFMFTSEIMIASFLFDFDYI